MALNTGLLPRPWSCDVPKVEGYEPMIRGKVQRVSRSKRNAWRVAVLVDGMPMFTSHHDTKQAAESKCAAMLETYATVHYRSR